MSFAQHFCPYQGTINIQAESPCDIRGWHQYKAAPMIFAPIDSKNCLSHDFFYCAKCEKFLKTHNTFSNIKKHAAIHVQSIRNEMINKKKARFLVVPKHTIKFTEEQHQFIAQKITKFVILGGLSFRKIEEESLDELSPFLPSRQDLKDLVEIVGQSTMEEISVVPEFNMMDYDACKKLLDKV